MKKNLSVMDFVNALKLDIIYMGNRDKMEIDTSDLNRPGLQMTGYFEYFAKERIQMFGMVEMTYLQDLPPEIRAERLDYFFSQNIPCVIIGRNLTPPDEMIECAKKYDVPVLMSGLTTTKLSHKSTQYLDNMLAPSISRHGGLMDVYGVGTMIMGESGVGKSETALELIKRGHRLVADDIVEIRKLADNELIGKSPDIVRHMMEIRGMGIIDVATLYGLGAVMQEKSIDMCIYLEPGDITGIDRLGITQEYITILGVRIPKITIPVRPGRNLAIILEVAAMNFRLRSMGHITASELDQKLLSILVPNEQ